LRWSVPVEVDAVKFVGIVGGGGFFDDGCEAVASEGGVVNGDGRCAGVLDVDVEGGAEDGCAARTGIGGSVPIAIEFGESLIRVVLDAEECDCGVGSYKMQNAERKMQNGRK